MGNALKILAAILLLGATNLLAQDASTLNIVIEPDPVELKVGEELQLKATLMTEDGEVLPDTLLFYSSSRRDLEVSREGYVTAHKPGTYTVIVLRSGAREERVRKDIEINVPYPPIAKIEFVNVPESVYSKTTTDLNVNVIDAMDLVRENPDLKITSDNQSVAMVSHGKLIAQKAGKAKITATAEGKTATLNLTVKNNPTASITIGNEETEVRTGDVINFNAKAMGSNGKEVDSPITYSYTAQPDDNLGQGAEGQVSQNGKFVANKPGLFTLTARSGNIFEEQIIRVRDRDVAQDVELVGHAKFWMFTLLTFWFGKALTGAIMQSPEHGVLAAIPISGMLPILQT